MSVKARYAVLCVLGTVLPYWQFIRFIRDSGLDVPLMVRLLFANGASGFFTLDVLMSAVALVVFMRVEAPRAGVTNRWLPVLALLAVGVSLALPLFLYQRESQRELAT